MKKREIHLEDFLKQFEDIKIGNIVPLIKWDPDWPIPDKFRIEKYGVKKKFKGNVRTMLRYRLLGRIEKNVEKPKTKRWYKGNIRRSGLKYIYEKNNLWVVLKSNWPTQLRLISLTFIVKDDWWQFVIPEHLLGVWFKYARNRINFTVIPKTIELDDSFWETFGILYGEMTRKSQFIALANTEPTLLNHILNFLDKIRLIDKDSWIISLVINSKNILIKNRESILKQAKEYWTNQLDINNLNIKKIYWYDCDSRLNPNFGEIDLRFSNLALRKVIDHLFQFVEKEIILNKDYAVPFIRGLIAAEGGFATDNDSIQMIRVASNLKNERELYKKVLKLIGLEVLSYENRHNLHIEGIPSFIKAKRIDIFKLHKKRRNNFLTCFSNSITIQIIYLLAKKPLTTRDIMEHLGLKNLKSTSARLGNLVNLGYLTREKTTNGLLYNLASNLATLINPSAPP